MEEELTSRFFSQVSRQCFTDDTLRLLELELTHADPQSMRQILRSHALSALNQIAWQPVETKLYILDFFVRASVLLEDTQSWLGLTYEGLVLRDLESARHPWLHVSETEWLKFAENSLRHHYYSICAQVCERALMQLQKRLSEDGEPGALDRDKIITSANNLKWCAHRAAAAGSVQVQALEHSKRKSALENRKLVHLSEESQVGSVLFRSGIKMRNAKNLSRSRNINPNLDCVFS